ncbi:MAG: SdrD B-like domain-containing protein [Planctomycetota bacterium]
MRTRQLAATAAVLFVACFWAAPATAEDIQGRVYANADNTDFRYDETEGDVALEGVVVELQLQTAGPDLPGSWVASTTTDANGLYLFDDEDDPRLLDIEPGEYRVVLPTLYIVPPNTLKSARFLLDPPPPPEPLIPPDGMAVYPPPGMQLPTQMPAAAPVMTSGGPTMPRTVDFPVSSTAPQPCDTVSPDIEGLVYTAFGRCIPQDLPFREDFDEPLPDRWVRVTGPETQDMVMTGPDGIFASPLPPPAGLDVGDEFQVTLEVQNNDDPMNPTFGPPTVVDVLITDIFDPSFAFYQYDCIERIGDCVLGSFSGRVFFDADGNGEFGPGDTGAQGVLVRLLDANGAPTGMSDPTDADGLYAFPALPDGGYQAATDDQGTFGGGSIVLGRDVEGVDLALPPAIPPDDCEPESCLEGLLHEAMFTTQIYVGDVVPYVDLAVDLWTADRTHWHVDLLRYAYAGPFTGPLIGVNEVITVGNVSVADGWATVRFKLTANPRVFPDGNFGGGDYYVVVKVNGRSNRARSAIRCDTARPGAPFPREPDCILIPPPPPPPPPPPGHGSDDDSSSDSSSSRSSSSSGSSRSGSSSGSGSGHGVRGHRGRALGHFLGRSRSLRSRHVRSLAAPPRVYCPPPRFQTVGTWSWVSWLDCQDDAR